MFTYFVEHTGHHTPDKNITQINRNFPNLLFVFKHSLGGKWRLVAGLSPTQQGNSKKRFSVPESDWTSLSLVSSQFIARSPSTRTLRYMFTKTSSAWERCPDVPHLSSGWYLCARKSPHALQLIFQQCPYRCLRNSSSVRLSRKIV